MDGNYIESLATSTLMATRPIIDLATSYCFFKSPFVIASIPSIMCLQESLRVLSDWYPTCILDFFEIRFCLRLYIGVLHRLEKTCYFFFKELNDSSARTPQPSALAFHFVSCDFFNSQDQLIHHSIFFKLLGNLSLSLLRQRRLFPLVRSKLLNWLEASLHRNSLCEIYFCSSVI